MLSFIILVAIIGLVVGLIARLLVPGRDHISILGTILLGIVGSFVGYVLERLVAGRSLNFTQLHPAGLLGSIVGAVVVLVLLRLTGLERGRSRHRI